MSAPHGAVEEHKMTAKWITSDNLGFIAFATKKAALNAYPQSNPIRIKLTFSDGWLALDKHSTENNGIAYLPDGRQIDVVSGFCCEYGKLIGLRGGTPKYSFEQYWNAIMARVVQAGIDRVNYKQ